MSPKPPRGADDRTTAAGAGAPRRRGKPDEKVGAMPIPRLSDLANTSVLVSIPSLFEDRACRPYRLLAYEHQGLWLQSSDLSERLLTAETESLTTAAAPVFVPFGQIAAIVPTARTRGRPASTSSEPTGQKPTGRTATGAAAPRTTRAKPGAKPPAPRSTSRRRVSKPPPGPAKDE